MHTSELSELNIGCEEVITHRPRDPPNDERQTANDAEHDHCAWSDAFIHREQTILSKH